MPAWELYDAQPEAYRNEVLPPEIRARVSVEAGQTMGWERYVGLDGVAVGIPRFGESAPGKVVAEKLGLTADAVAAAARLALERSRK